MNWGTIGTRFSDYDAALRIRPDFAAALANRGLVLHRLERYTEAIADYDQVQQLAPESAWVHYNRGRALAAAEKPAEAIAQFRFRAAP